MIISLELINEIVPWFMADYEIISGAGSHLPEVCARSRSLCSLLCIRPVIVYFYAVPHACRDASCAEAAWRMLVTKCVIKRCG
jgi:hypothetical protein